MAGLFEAALAPALIGLCYIYIRDKYEKEPVGLLVTGVFYGCYLTAVVFCLCRIFEAYTPTDEIKNIFYTSFITSAGAEELTKFIFLYFLIWRNKNFNEPFDGIVYSVFISLGYASVENIIYVINPEIGGYGTALSRAVYSVPGHAFMGIAMGYRFAEAKYDGKPLIMSFLSPWLMHAIYNSLLMSEREYLLFIFIPFLIFVWRSGFAKMKIMLERSPFKRSIF
ncbi:MAG: PrsW family intramembrane metalloprotease [Lachnospiraceae bacterium]|nr:PrsW family intramembrane metalloprotease [Lachnospiraceae bacterium]